ncbi:MAG: DNA ligase, partial [Actinobacteria bacterium]|nr:DNA ligase [Actinomycetota bacterium]
ASMTIAYHVFDLPWLDGEDLCGLPYVERRARLEALALDGPAWRTPPWHDDGPELLRLARAHGLEGVIAKRLDSPYRPGGRSGEWIKVKITRRDEFVVGGYALGTDGRSLGALLLGWHEDGALRFAGKVGTGFTDATLRDLATRFAPLARDTNPFDDHIPYRKAHFLEPELVGQVEFLEWTHNHTLRAPSYKGLRDDKAAKDVRREP